MKLTEIKNNLCHYFEDEHGRKQGECKSWHESGRLCSIRHFRDGLIHGESKMWYENGQKRVIAHSRDGGFHGEYKGWDSSGNLIDHYFDVNGEEIIDFLKNPELYPETPEEKIMFVLKYGNAPFIGDSSNETV